MAKVVLGCIHLLRTNKVQMYSFLGVNLADFVSVRQSVHHIMSSSCEYLSHRCFIFANNILKMNDVPSSTV